MMEVKMKVLEEKENTIKSGHVTEIARRELLLERHLASFRTVDRPTPTGSKASAQRRKKWG
jgi:hypothetical protein